MKSLVRFLWPSVKKYRIRFLLMTILILSWSLQNSVIPLVFGKIIDGFVECSDKSLAWQVVGSSILTYLGFCVFVHLCCRIGGFIRASLLPEFAASVRMRTFEDVEKKSYNYFVEHLSGDISSKIYMLQEKIARLFSAFIYTILPSLLSLILAFYLFCFVKPEIAFAMLFWLIAHMFTCVFMGRKCSRYESDHSSANNLLSGCIVDCISNHFLWKIFSNEDFEYKNTSKYQKKEVITAKRSQRYITKLHMVLSILSITLSLCGINMLSYYYWQASEISIGDFVFILNATLGIEMLAWNVGLELPDIFADIGSCRQAFSVISKESYVRDISEAKELVITKGSIIFENVSFEYNKEWIFEGLSLKMEPNEKIGFVGKSGSGKTTFINLLLRLHDLKSGRILVDNQDIASVTQKSLRNCMSVVPQDPILFHRSILENIKYGKQNATEKEIEKAIQKAHMEDILEGKDLDFDAGEGGKKLSKGQRQRVAIARAFLKDSPILILDEVTSALDAVSEKAVQKSLDEIMQGKTVIAIAHRLSTLQKMDRIFVFDNGRVVGTGAHEELLQNCEIYQELWKAQKEGFMGT